MACYHDQGLIPVKLLAFGSAVNVTLGLPIIRTSVDHGTAFDIAGQGVADPRQPGRGGAARRRLAARRRGHAMSAADPAAAPAARASRSDGDETLIADNRKAFHDYHVLETFEAGMQLLGTEVKGIREGKANLRDSYARVEKGEVWLYNVHINPYSHRGYADHDPQAPAQAAAAQAGDPQADRQDAPRRA